MHRLVDKNIREGTLTEAAPPTSDHDTTQQGVRIRTYVLSYDRESHMYDFSATARLMRFKRISQMLAESDRARIRNLCWRNSFRLRNTHVRANEGVVSNRETGHGFYDSVRVKINRETKPPVALL